MLEDQACRVLCQQNLNAKDADAFKKAVQRKYHHNWIIDNLPAASLVDSDQFITTQFVGFPVGYTEGTSAYLYNHVNIIMEYHTVEADAYRYSDLSAITLFAA
jgi:transmembrane 9 superfamily protein 2/4